MNPIEKRFREFLGTPSRNPSGEDDISEFLRYLSGVGDLQAWTESDWVAFGHLEDMSDKEIAEMIEQAAGWVEDTTEGREAPAKAAWAK